MTIRRALSKGLVDQLLVTNWCTRHGMSSEQILRMESLTGIFSFLLIWWVMGLLFFTACFDIILRQSKQMGYGWSLHIVFGVVSIIFWTFYFATARRMKLAAQLVLDIAELRRALELGSREPLNDVAGRQIAEAKINTLVESICRAKQEARHCAESYSSVKHHVDLCTEAEGQFQDQLHLFRKFGLITKSADQYHLS